MEEMIPMYRILANALLWAVLCAVPFGAMADTITLYAAGSLKAALGDASRDFEKATGHTRSSTRLRRRVCCVSASKKVSRRRSSPRPT